MTHDVEMELSLWEMLLSVRRHWAIVVISMLVCAVAGGAFGYIRITRSQDAVVSEEEAADNWRTDSEHKDYVLDTYEANQKLAQDVEAFNREESESIRQEWYQLEEYYKNDPLMSLDATACERERMTIVFDSDSGSHSSLVYDWLQNADANSLFGDAKDTLSPYKNELIRIDSTSDLSAETSLSLISVDDFNTSQATTYLKSWFTQCAVKAGLKIKHISTSHATGYYAPILDTQNDILDRMSRIRDRLSGMYEAAIAESVAPTFEEQAATTTTTPAADTGINWSQLLKYALVGFALGLFIGAAIAIFMTLRQGCLISRRQVEDTFGLELLGDCSKDNPAALEILNANLDIMLGDEAGVMLIGTQASEDVAPMVSEWNKKSKRSFVAGRDIIDDSETIDALNGVEGILLGVRIGASRLADIQRLMIRAHRLDKKILGYVQL